MARALSAARARTGEIPAHLELARTLLRAAGARGRRRADELEAWAARRGGR